MGKTTTFALLGMIAGIGHATAASLLQAQPFPKTAADLSFADTTALLTAGYAPFEATFDTAGNCISGCAYGGLTLEDELDMMRRAGEMATATLAASGYHAPVTSPITGGNVAPTVEPVQFPTAPTPTGPQIPTVTPPVGGVVPAPDTGALPPRPIAQCTPNQPNITPNQKAPYGAPLVGELRITSPFGPRVHPVTGQTSVHYAIDLAAAMGTDVFTTANGTVTAVTDDATCGRGIRIKHAMGFETQYCHLNEQLVSVGDTVSAGCRIAKSGKTGRVTGPHLHYGILYNGKPIDPSQYIWPK